MSNYQDRINARIATLTSMVDVAEKVKAEGQGARRFAANLSVYLRNLDAMKDEALTVFGSLDKGLLDAWAATIPATEALSKSVAQVAGSDRTEGDAIARMLSANLADGMFEGEEAESITALVTRWQASAPTTTGGGRTVTRDGSSSAKVLGFMVTVTDQASGKRIASTNVDNLNSLRDQLRRYYAQQHNGVKPSRGEPMWEGWTEALDAVMHKGASAAEGGGFTFARSGAQVTGEAPQEAPKAPEADQVTQDTQAAA